MTSIHDTRATLRADLRTLGHGRLTVEQLRSDLKRDLIRLLAAATDAGISLTEACDLAGVSRQTGYNLLNAKTRPRPVKGEGGNDVRVARLPAGDAEQSVPAGQVDDDGAEGEPGEGPE